MAITLVAGDVASDLEASGLRKLDIADRISYLEPNNAPFVALLRRMGKVKATSPKVEWFESESMPRFDIASASAISTSGTTALGVTNPTYFRIGDGVRVTETGEFVEVTGVSASAIGVKRGIGGSATIASFTSAAGLYIVNNANAEGASLRTIKTVQPVNKVNYCQIIRTPFGVTGTVLATDFYGQFTTERDRLQYEMGLHHEQQIESTFFWGGGGSEDTTTSGAPKRWCKGLADFITTNVTPAGGTLTRATFETFLRSAFRYGSDRKVLFASPVFAAALDGFAWNSVASGAGTSMKQEIAVGGTAIGVAVKQYISSQGIVDVVLKRHWNDNTNTAGSAFLVDMDSVRMAYLRDTKLLMDRQANDADKVEDEYLSEVTLVVEHERRHAKITGITG